MKDRDYFLAICWLHIGERKRSILLDNINFPIAVTQNGKFSRDLFTTVVLLAPYTHLYILFYLKNIPPKLENLIITEREKKSNVLV